MRLFAKVLWYFILMVAAMLSAMVLAGAFILGMRTILLR